MDDLLPTEVDTLVFVTDGNRMTPAPAESRPGMREGTALRRRGAIPDPLHEAIEKAIQGPLSGQLFERCAVDLLRDNYYSKLRGTPPGHDAGIDGIVGPDAEPEFVLVATTAKDFARNLRRSVQSHLDAGGPGRRFVFATTREVTGKRRLQLGQQLEVRFRGPTSCSARPR